MFLIAEFGGKERGTVETIAERDLEKARTNKSTAMVPCKQHRGREGRKDFARIKR